MQLNAFKYREDLVVTESIVDWYEFPLQTTVQNISI